MSEAAEFAHAMYAGSDDPWQIGVGFYERRKREIVLACLPQQQFRSAFEPGCGTGELTLPLAERCDRILATDLVPRAVQLARQRLGSSYGAWVRTSDSSDNAVGGGVEIRQMGLPDWPSDRRFDLVVLSELGYYLLPSDWRNAIGRMAETLLEPWTVVACHWMRPFAERLQSTDDIHAVIGERLPGRRLLLLQDADFRLEVWSSLRSVAGAEGR